MKKFEYKTALIKGKPLGFIPAGDYDTEEFDTVLKEHGEEGWELVQCFPGKGIHTSKYFFGILGFTPAMLRLVFKREIQQ